MGVLGKVNFWPTSETILHDIRDFDLNDPLLNDPSNANPLLDGEFITIDPTAKKAVRALDSGVGVGALKPSWPVFRLKGAYSSQVTGKVPVIYHPDIEADTLVFKQDDAYGIGDELVIGTVTIDAKALAGLKKRNAIDPSEFGIGYVIKLPADNDGKLRAKLHLV